VPPFNGAARKGTNLPRDFVRSTAYVIASADFASDMAATARPRITITVPANTRLRATRAITSESSPTAMAMTIMLRPSTAMAE
jgi:hypothetical protein